MRDWYYLLVLKIDCFGLTTFGHHAMPFAQPPSSCIQPQLQATQ
jgi:hypothetical protein